MKIITLSCIQNYPINSGGKSLSFFINNILARFFSLDFFYVDYDSYVKGFKPNNLNFISYHLRSGYAKIFLFFPAFFKKMHFEFFIDRSKLKTIKADIILLEFPYLYGLARIISSYNKHCPIILLCHNREFEYFRSIKSLLWPLVYLYEDYVLKRLQYIITISPQDYDYFSKKYTHAHVRYYETGVIKELFSPHGKKIAFDTSHKHILFYGSINNPTNKEALLYIKKEIAPFLDKLWSVHIVGNDQEEQNLSESNLIFYGRVDNPFDYIRSVDVVLLPLKNSAGVKIRMLESLYAEKVILGSPESVVGLKQELQSCVIVCQSSKDYLDMIYKIQHDSTFVKNHKNHVSNIMKNYKENVEKNLISIIDEFIEIGRK